MSTVQNQIISPYNSMKGKDFLKLSDFNATEVKKLLQLALQLKEEHKKGIHRTSLKGKNLALLFDKASTRTRVSFTVGMTQLGGSTITLTREASQLGRGETIADTAKTLSQYVDALVIRTDQDDILQTFAEHASIPVINGLTHLYHPCQALADLMTLQELKGDLTQVTLTYIGDGNNVLHSLLIGAALMGMHLRFATPRQYSPDNTIYQQALKIAKFTGSKLEVYSSPLQAAYEADAIYTDVWASMGQESEKAKRKLDFAGFTVNQKVMDLANPDALFMHCLPAYRGLEVSADVIEGKQSVVFQQAENRLHVQKSLLMALLSNEGEIV
ncbi:ornithine carbamoyltransferase [Hazenella sp. IB182357]|uniref:Ornithine carbamoyltransferase n=1 Tax=Polycladospora coralii TaxID=2771432 RepID=A0A926N9W0_9BACL|nr:ornithine carbamoyltransferase [Polycladospora coralii]MBD1372532.1 ornithine carbamoyltransferase [Polycladospora coralii]MBS7531345.1 ornithine carbamoyltransferase [Polycladospora coralii]